MDARDPLLEIERDSSRVVRDKSQHESTILGDLGDESVGLSIRPALPGDSDDDHPVRLELALDDLVHRDPLSALSDERSLRIVVPERVGILGLKAEERHLLVPPLLGADVLDAKLEVDGVPPPRRLSPIVEGELLLLLLRDSETKHDLSSVRCGLPRSRMRKPRAALLLRVEPVLRHSEGPFATGQARMLERVPRFVLQRAHRDVIRRGRTGLRRGRCVGELLVAVTSGRILGLGGLLILAGT